MGTTLKIQNSIQEEIKSRLKSGNACYHSVQNILCCSLLSQNFKIKMYRIIILPVVVYRCETWSLTLRKELRLRVFENMVLGRIFGPKRGEVTREWKKTTLSSLIFRRRASCILGQTFHCSPENAFYIFNKQIYFII